MINYFKKWFDDGAEKLRYEYDLNENSIILDLGLYNGEFTNKIYAKYNCRVYGFEPVTKFFCSAVSNVEDTNKIKLFNYGIGSRTRVEFIYLNNDETSIYRETKDKEIVLIRSIDEIIKELDLVTVNLIKVNTEGSEFEILNAILDNNFQRMFKNIQVQFHTFMPDAEKRRAFIIERLEETHEPTFSYPFVWENFRLVK